MFQPGLMVLVFLTSHLRVHVVPIPFIGAYRGLFFHFPSSMVHLSLSPLVKSLSHYSQVFKFFVCFRHYLSLLPGLVLNLWAQVIFLPQPPTVESILLLASLFSCLLPEPSRRVSECIV